MEPTYRDTLRRFIGCILLAGALALSGCGRVEDDETGGRLLRARLDAAQSIEGESGKKDSALCRIATDAAAAGDTELVMRALQDIAEPERRDRTASAAALALANADKTEDAKGLAKRIKDANLKDETLVKIAGGSQAVVLRGHLDAALSMKGDSDTQDAALTKVAKDAADAGETELVEEALRAITKPDQQDHAAQEAVVALARAGATNDALFYARKIEDPTLRHNALERIAGVSTTRAPSPDETVDSSRAPIGKRSENLTIDGISAIAVIVIASFAIDRIVRLVLFGLSNWSLTRHWLPEPESIPADADQNDASLLGPDDRPLRGRARWTRAKAEKRQKAAYYALCFALGAGVLGAIGKVTIFRALGFHQTWFPLDCIMTGLILTAGAERVAGLLKLPGAPEAEKAPPRPIEIKGTLKLEGEASKQLADTPQETAGD